MSNFIIPFCLHPFRARPSRTEALAAHAALMIHPETSKTLAKQYGATDPGKLVQFQRLLFVFFSPMPV
ncbi:hypothetical protein ARMGADRAFT_1013497 [Armillaria gallica]|uniref:Uncharacterized protein n=1 Tax=Armillaria gallica TaxID=47427 RepID=A0A2H3DAK9_ARMGA|nr:hypothetical protein ARMGADRAFT_1013497 [Armillaria gallica]